MVKSLIKLFGVLGVAFSFVACGSDDLPEKDVENAVPVKVVIAEIQPLMAQSVYSGTVEPIERVRLSTKIMGWVDRIYYEEGDPFEKDAILVKLRNRDLEAKRAQAGAAIAEAAVHFRNAATNLKRIEALFANKAATQKELDDMRAAFASAEARKSSAEKMKVEVDEILRYASLTAPFSGRVGRKMIQVGEMANPGQPILEIENSDRIKIVAKVPENEIETLREGMPVQILIAAVHAETNGNSMEGVINRIVPAADPMSRQFEIHVVADNPGRRIKSGMFARVVTGKTQGAALLVPTTAVFRRGQLEGIFVVDEESRARLRWIRTGSEYNGLVDVLSGVTAGEQVVVEGASKLLDGQLVKVGN